MIKEERDGGLERLNDRRPVIDWHVLGDVLLLEEVDTSYGFEAGCCETVHRREAAQVQKMKRNHRNVSEDREESECSRAVLGHHLGSAT